MKTIRILMLLCVLGACGGKETLQGLSLGAERTINYGDTVQMVAAPVPAAATLPTLYWEHSHPDVVELLDNNGTVAGRRVGAGYVRVYTTDRAHVDSVRVVVLPTNFFYADPVTSWGYSKLQVKLEEDRAVTAETATGLLFAGENNNVRWVMYLFEDGGMHSAMVGLTNTAYSVEQAVEYLGQRYQYVGNDDGFFVFMGDADIAALSYDSSFGLNVMYVQRPQGARVSSWAQYLKGIMARR